MSKQDWDKTTRMQNKDVVRFRPFGHPITINEIHAAQIGIVAGFIIGMAYLYMPDIALVSALILLGYAIIGKPFGRSLSHDAETYATTMGVRTIKHEPWYFLTFFGLLFVTVVVTDGVLR